MPRARPSRAAAAVQRRADLLRVALDCFASKGFTRTTMRDVQTRARASTGSLYYHFESKEQLAAALYVDGIRKTQAFRLAAMRRQRSAKGKIRALVRSYLAWVEANPKLASFLLGMRHAEFMASAEDEMTALNRDFEQGVREMLRPHIDRGEIRALGADVSRAVLTGPSEHFARQWLAGRTRTDLAQATRMLAETAWRALDGSAR